MSYRLQARDPRDTSGDNINPVRIPTCNHCHKDLNPDFDDMNSDFCDAHADTCEMFSDCCAGSIVEGGFCSVCREECGPGSCVRCEEAMAS